METKQIIVNAPPTLPDPLRATLLESRQRWQGFGMIAADLMFETDLAGRLTFLAPDRVLGWPVGDLLGKAPAVIHHIPGEAGAPDPFCCIVPVRDRRVWMRDALAGDVCMSLSSVPLLDQLGRRVGTRGVGVDVTERERQDAVRAVALRRGDALDHILGGMRHEVMAPRIIQAVLDTMMRAVGGQGAVVLDLTPAPMDQAPALPWPVLH